MTQAHVKSLLELVDERPAVNNQEVFDHLWSLLGELRSKIGGRFALHPDESTAALQPYHSLDGTAKGMLSGWSGPEVDWMVHSWIGTPQSSFTNMHLTCWLGPQIKVPHFGMALGTMPDVFVYIDYVPRVDLMTDLAYLDTYYDPPNSRYVALRSDPRYVPFVSKSLYMRQAQSQTSMCFLVKPEAEILATISEVAHEMMDRWLGWIDQAPPVPQAERAALAERDLLVRRSIADRDPANAMGVRLFGDELTNRLVRALWGGDRTSARPGSM